MTTGVTVWLTGLPSAGKTTLAHALGGILEAHSVDYEVLDGDVMREFLTKDLGFSKEDRDINVRRIGFVASLLARHGTVVLCPVISPYRAVRDEVRALHAPGSFVEVHVATPVEVCEVRDVKGLYGKARRGEISGMTGVDDPYEPPHDPELVVHAGSESVESSAGRIWNELKGRIGP